MEITNEEYKKALEEKNKLRDELFRLKVEIAYLSRDEDTATYTVKEEQIKKQLVKVYYTITNYQTNERGKKI